MKKNEIHNSHIDPSKPTIENPFATTPVKPKTKEELSALNSPKSVPKITLRTTVPKYSQTIEEEQDLEIFDPGFYLSENSKTLIREYIKNGVISNKELPFIFETSLVISDMFDRMLPTLSDIEAAINLGSLDQIKRIASGEEVMTDISRKETGHQPITSSQAAAMWKEVASVVAQYYSDIEAKNLPIVQEIPKSSFLRVQDKKSQ